MKRMCPVFMIGRAGVTFALLAAAAGGGVATGGVTSYFCI